MRSFNESLPSIASCVLLESLLPSAQFDGILDSETHKFNVEQKKKTSKRLFIRILSVFYLQ